jgi:hypothetical protein
MKEKGLRVSQTIVRVVASLTLVTLALSLVSDRYYGAASRSFANSRVGIATMIWMTVTSLLLPAYVALEGWWMRRLKIKSGALWIDGILAAACLTLFFVVVLVGFTHYVMF